MGDDVFDAAWLALREAADHRARAGELDDILARAGERLGWSRVLDLGCGTGSNLRYLGPRLPWAGTWTLLDHDVGLLERALADARSASGQALPARDQSAPTSVGPPGASHDAGTATHPEAHGIVGDLRREGIEAIGASDLVTASALLDLVSESWIEALVAACARQGAGAMFALSFDGGMAWHPRDPDDESIRTAITEHQQCEKGLGRALGPDATAVAVTHFEAAGYATWSAESPWRLSGARDRALASALLEGWIGAAIEVRPAEREAIEAWGRRRADVVHGDAYEIVVGHRDLLALPGRPP